MKPTTAFFTFIRQNNYLVRHSIRLYASQSPKKPRRSRKILTDLPEAYVLPNGELATPLAHWNDPSLSKPEPVLSQTDSGEIPRTRKSRKRTLPSEEEPTVSPGPKSQLAREILDNLQRFPHCLLLTRVGSFYESYFDQASEIASLLNIKLTSRRWDGSRVPMCGFPIIHLDKYLKILVQQHKRSVAMCEEFQRQSQYGEREFDRRITRIISPGTLIDEPFLEPSNNNFLLAIACSTVPPTNDSSTESLGLAWADVSTGEFYSKEVLLKTLEDELVRINPKEIVIDPLLSTVPEIYEVITELIKEQGIQHTTHSANATTSSPVPPASQPPVLSLEAEAALLLTLYLHSTLLEFSRPLGEPTRENDGSHMHIDAHTIKSLELRETDYEDSARGSLLSVIKRTTTQSGARLLSRRLCSPSSSLSEIEDWQSLVSFFLARPHLSQDLRDLLRDAGDIGRIVQRFLLRKGGIDDLIALKKTIEVWTKIVEQLDTDKKLHGGDPLQRKAIDEFSRRLEDLTTLAARIEGSIIQHDDLSESDVEDRRVVDTSTSNEAQSSGDALKWSINPNFSLKLSSLYAALQKLIKRKEELEERLRSDYKAPSLSLRSSAQQGMHVHIARRKKEQTLLNADEAFLNLSETISTKTYIYQGWSQLGGEIGNMTLAVAAAEREAFAELIDEVLKHADALKSNAAVQDELDVALGFATLANDLRLVRPKMTTDATYHVVNGRHPSVEMGLNVSGRIFTPNTVDMNETSSMHIITGPNMAGKSTALRQAALIAILAQIGSYVPAEQATIGVVDRLFTRIGAKDDLFRDRSTFMVEMMETGDILQRATPNSLVIMDEVGRGTTMKDGLAIAFATVHHLVTQNRSRCFFATHFHELADMLDCNESFTGGGAFSNVRFMCTDVDEIDENRFVYSYRLRPGVNKDSHGLKVAQLAGLPASTIDIAKKTLHWLRADTNFNYRALSQEISLSQSFNKSVS